MKKPADAGFFSGFDASGLAVGHHALLGAATVALAGSLALLATAGRLSLPTRLVRPPALILTHSGQLAILILLPDRRAIPRRELDLQVDDFVPHGVRAVALGDGEQLPQAAARIRAARFFGLGFRCGGVRRRGVRRLVWRWLFFVHTAIMDYPRGRASSSFTSA